ncbi:MAG: cyclopropane fatty acyl phospholipid synthase [Desulfovermiculus sp.]
MHSPQLQPKVQELLDLARVGINGSNPWDIRVHDQRFYARVLAEGSLGLGESYMDRWWDCDRLDQFFYRILSARLDNHVNPKKDWIPLLKARVLNMQNPVRAYTVGRHHYDIGNELYERMLDSRMIYSCGYWKEAGDLEEAQEAKLDLVCRKLGLEPGMRVLDIGCGWGGTAKFAAERYGVKVVGVTVSQEQVNYGQELCQGLPVDIRYQDYRSLTEKFDRILSLGMFEHVGVRNYRTFMHQVQNLLADDGLFLLHTIGRLESKTDCDPWISRYIFPNSMLPSAKQICEAFEGLFVLEDWHSFGPDYDSTLMAWHDNFTRSWEELRGIYDERFFRMWNYYLLSCAGSFRARSNQLWQLVLSPHGINGRYEVPR